MRIRNVLVAGAVVVALYGGWRPWTHRAVLQSPGVLVSADPQQGPVDRPRQFERDGYTLTAQATYHIKARLLGREAYALDREADLSPVDFALGWGPMSDSAVLEQLDLSQGGRFYHLHWSSTPRLPAAELLRHSANTHMVPATPSIARALAAMRPGQVVELEGYLVNVSAADGWHWNTSLKRTDRGAGACELLWVEEARVVAPEEPGR